jgi:hypothetical protein
VKDTKERHVCRVRAQIAEVLVMSVHQSGSKYVARPLATAASQPPATAGDK